MKAKDHLIDFFCRELMVHVIVNMLNTFVVKKNNCITHILRFAFDALNSRKWVNQRYPKLSNCLVLVWQECFGPLGLVITLVQPGKIVGNDVTTFGAEFTFELRKKLHYALALAFGQAAGDAGCDPRRAHSFARDVVFVLPSRVQASTA